MKDKEKEEKIRAKASVAKSASEYPKGIPSSITGGVIPMSIVGRFDDERQRLGPEFTEAERKWRVRWYQGQNLAHGEPRHVPQLDTAYLNPIRRFYRAPMDYVEKNIFAPKMGAENGNLVRRFLGKGTMVYFGVLYIWYSLKYNHHTWEKVYGPRVTFAKPSVYPGDPRYPVENARPNAEDYFDIGFKARNVFTVTQ